MPLSEEGVFPAIDLSAPPVAIRSGAKGARARASEDDVEEEEGPAQRRSNWPTALLASYASAVTIGLIWVLWGHRAPREGVEPDPFPPAETAADPGQRADQSRKLVPPSPLPADRVARPGQTLRVGSLELTPLEVSSGPVVLRHAIKDDEWRRGGQGALALRVRLKNVSIDSIFSPMDEAFLRERGRGVLDSFIETGTPRQVAMFPLAVVSEWSIVGQEFRELLPGESYETLVVSAPDVAGTLGADELTWRIRLRTGIDRTATVGVRFRAADVVPRPGPPLPKRKEPAKRAVSVDDL